jgi:hypothetical protein
MAGRCLMQARVCGATLARADRSVAAGAPADQHAGHGAAALGIPAISGIP